MVVLLATVGVSGLQNMQDQYINHIMTETSAEVVIRGRGSGYHDPSRGEGMSQYIFHLVLTDYFNPLSLILLKVLQIPNMLEK